MKKIRVAVLYGGRSGEHEVSLRSAASVLKNLDPARFDVVPIAIDKEGHWILNDIKQLLHDSAIQSLPVRTASHALLSAPGRLTTQTKTHLSNGHTDFTFDVVFPVLHGPLGEDGTVQGIFELADIPYVGSNVLSSAMVMDKDVAKRLVLAAGLPVTPFVVVKDIQWKNNAEHYKKIIAAQLRYPLFVKPANVGSSVGIHKVKRSEALDAAIADACLYDNKVLIEQGVDAREIEISLLENPIYGAEPLVSLPGEIIPNHEFYSYEAKYLDENGAALLAPAPLSEMQIKTVQTIAQQIFGILECEGMARIDFLLDKNTGSFFFSEANTLPGFTKISMYPKMWEVSGISYRDLLSRLIDLAVARHQRKQHLKREWALS